MSKTIAIDGKQVIFQKVQTDDGGMVLMTLVPVQGAGPDVEYREYREWTGKGIFTRPDGTVSEPTPAETEVARDQVRAEYDALDATNGKVKADKALETRQDRAAARAAGR